MKKIISLAVLFLAIIINSNAQLSKSNFLINGSISYNQQKNNTSQDVNKNNHFNISPSVGYFITDKFVLGLGANFFNNSYQNESKTYNSSSKYSQTGINGGIFARYYLPINERFAFFGQGFSTFGKSNINLYSPNSTSETVSNYSDFDVTVAPGLVFFPTKKVGIEMMFGSIGYNNSSGKIKDDPSHSKIKSSGFNAGFQLSNLSLGISLYI